MKNERDVCVCSVCELDTKDFTMSLSQTNPGH